MDFTAASLYGMTPQAPSVGPASAPISDPATTDPLGTGWRRLTSPANPLFWAGALILVTVGAIGVAGSVRLGRAQLSVSADKG